MLADCAAANHPAPDSYPIASETPSLDSRVWKYWRSSGEEFHVVYNRRGVVEYVRADYPNLRSRVTAR